MSSYKKKFISDVMHTLITKAILVVLKLSVSVMTARILGPTGRGIFFTSIQTAGGLNTVGTLSVGEGLIYRISRGFVATNQVFGTVALIASFFTLIICSILYLLESFIIEKLLR